VTLGRPYVGRFAPSPTARQHIGNLRTALIAWLDARSQDGRIVLRIEDLDPDRSRAEFSGAIADDYRLLGLDWDEGPDRPGGHGPYLQSGRSGVYREVLESLRAKNLVYPCFCSRREIETAAGAPAPGEDGPVYPGTCRNLDPSEAERRIRSGEACAWRFRAGTGEIRFSDVHYGGQVENVQAAAGDFVVFRKDGVASYQLAVVTDDELMGTTCVVRGADLLASTARQIALQQAMGWRTPDYLHVPLVVAPGGRKFAKRERDISLDRLLGAGWTADRVTGFLAFSAGLVPAPDPAAPAELLPVYSRRKLRLESFELDPAVFS